MPRICYNSGMGDIVFVVMARAFCNVLWPSYRKDRTNAPISHVIIAQLASSSMVLHGPLILCQIQLPISRRWLGTSQVRTDL